MFKKLLSLALATVMVIGMGTTTAFAANQKDSTSTNQKNLEIVTDEAQIDTILKEKGIYEEGEEVVAVIELKTEGPEHTQIQPRLIFREIYSEYSSSYEGTKSSPRYTQNYPAGNFDFEQSFSSGWQLNANLGLKTEAFEAAIGYELNASTTDTFTYHSDYYSYPITVKAYVNYEREYYDIYDRDLMYDDYIGRTSVEREIGYTVKVTRR